MSRLDMRMKPEGHEIEDENTAREVQDALW
jgi:hypothetical protein